MQTIYNNGRIAMTKDLVFGLVVWDGNVWYPVQQLDKRDLDLTKSLVDFDPVFPWKDELYGLQPKEKAAYHSTLIPVNNGTSVEKPVAVDFGYRSADEISNDPVTAVEYLSQRAEDLRTLETSLEKKEGPGYAVWQSLESFPEVLLTLRNGVKKSFKTDACAKAYLLASFF